MSLVGGQLARSPASDRTVSRWAALGDSFTAGTAADELTWARMIASDLAPAYPLALESFAHMGATIADLEREQLPLAVASDPHLVTLICGGNDVIRRVRPSIGSLERDLDRIWMTLRMRLPDAQRVTATYPAVAPDALRERTRRRIVAGMGELNAVIRAAAARHGVRCIELAHHPGRVERTNYAADGIHPSPVGHRAAAAVIGPVLEGLLAARAEANRNEEED